MGFEPQGSEKPVAYVGFSHLTGKAALVSARFGRHDGARWGVVRKFAIAALSTCAVISVAYPAGAQLTTAGNSENGKYYYFSGGNYNVALFINSRTIIEYGPRRRAWVLMVKSPKNPLSKRVSYGLMYYQFSCNTSNYKLIRQTLYDHKGKVVLRGESGESEQIPIPNSPLSQVRALACGTEPIVMSEGFDISGARTRASQFFDGP